MAEFPIVDDPKSPRTAQNNVEAFNIKWTNASGRRSGNGRSSEKAARALAAKVADRGATDITIERTWIAGYAF